MGGCSGRCCLRRADSGPAGLEALVTIIVESLLNTASAVGGLASITEEEAFTVALVVASEEASTGRRKAFAAMTVMAFIKDSALG